MSAACPDCLARGLLLRHLAAHLERAVAGRAGARARDLLALDSADLAAAVTASAAAARAALARSRSGSAHGELERDLARAGCSSICRHRPGWPDGLRRLGAGSPAALFLRGEAGLLARLEDERAVTVVGARRAGAYGREVARGLAAQLAAAGIPVVSGMAFGIDAAAHDGALAAGGPTVAVLGSGPERPYPRSRAGLYRRICDRGLIASELPPATPIFRWTFPARNRLMAALGGITVVVEAGERSGSLITAEMAADCGRTVGAVPGPVNSWRSTGTNRLLADGARLVRDGADVLEELLGPGAPAVAAGPALEPGERAVLDAFEGGAGDCDAAAAACGLPVTETATTLMRLELAGYLARRPDGGYRRTALSSPAANTMDG